MNLLKELEAVSSSRRVNLPIPPTLTLGINLYKLTFISYFQFSLSFQSVKIEKAISILRSWEPRKSRPICILKASNETRVLWEIEECIEVVHQLCASSSQFVLQKFIVTSEIGASLIRVQYEPTSGYNNCYQFKAKDGRTDYLIDEQEKSEAVIPPSKLIDFSKVVNTIVQKFVANKPIQLIQVDFLKDLKGQVYFLKVFQYQFVKRAKTIMVKYVSKSVANLDPKRNRIKKANTSNPSPEKSGKIRRYQSANSVNNESSIRTLKGLISTVSQTINNNKFPPSMLFKETMKILMKKIEKRREKRKVDPFYVRPYDYNEISFSKTDKHLGRLFITNKAKEQLEKCSLELDHIRKKFKPAIRQKFTINRKTNLY